MARPKLIKKNQWYRILNGKQTKYTHLHWRVKTNASHLSTQLVYTGTHIAWMLRHNDAVIFIKIEHSFFTAKLAQPHAWRKSAYFGWLRRCSVCRTFFSCKKGIRVVRVPSCFSMLGRIIGAFCRDRIFSSCCSGWRWSSCASSCSCR